MQLPICPKLIRRPQASQDLPDSSARACNSSLVTRTCQINNFLTVHRSRRSHMHAIIWLFRLQGRLKLNQPALTHLRAAVVSWKTNHKFLESQAFSRCRVIFKKLVQILRLKTRPFKVVSFRTKVAFWLRPYLYLLGVATPK